MPIVHLGATESRRFVLALNVLLAGRAAYRYLTTQRRTTLVSPSSTS